MYLNRRSFMVASGAICSAAATFPASAERRLIVDGLNVSNLSQQFIQQLRESNVNCVHTSLGGSTQNLGRLYKFADEHSNDVLIARSANDILYAHDNNRISFVIGTQAANYLESLLKKNISGRYDPMVFALRAHWELGVRIHSLCYNVSNIFGGGCLDHDAPLTRAGERLVEEIHNLNMVLDIGGHTGEQTSLEAIAISGGRPVICSHTNVRSLNPSLRAISNRLIEAIAETDGVIGITGVSDYHIRHDGNHKEHGPVSPKATLEMHLDQYDYVRDLVGVEHVGLGSDFTWPRGQFMKHEGKVSLTFPPELLSDGPILYVENYGNISQLDNVIAGLKDRGWSKSELSKLLGENWLRVYRKVWGS